MLLGWLFASRRRAPALLCRRRGLPGPTPWVIAIMIAPDMIVAAAGLALANLAGSAARRSRAGVTVQIVEAAPAERDRQAGARLARAARPRRASPACAAVPEAELAPLLERWLGPAGGRRERDLPVPALIDVELRRPGRPPPARRLRAARSRRSPRRRGSMRQSRLAGAAARARSPRCNGWRSALVAADRAGHAAAVVLAARGALDTHRGTIEVDARHRRRPTSRSRACSSARSRSTRWSAARSALAARRWSRSPRWAAVRRARSAARRRRGCGWVDWLLLALLPFVGVVLADWLPRG